MKAHFCLYNYKMTLNYSYVYCRLRNMDRLQEIIDRLIDLSSALPDAATCIKDLVEPKPDSWHGYVEIP